VGVKNTNGSGWRDFMGREREKVGMQVLNMNLDVGGGLGRMAEDNWRVMVRNFWDVFTFGIWGNEDIEEVFTLGLEEVVGFEDG
ncbi:hypothetical protein, partial [Bacillus altitudinis]|uniref:hypothetical protein n=1 Tax=Bacillus altitudinis TaxID=293387 RepID=UPI001C92CC7A